MGFGTHPHRDMEIFSFVMQGTLAHKDSLGNGRQLGRGEIQLMSAGTGVAHSEFNPSETEWLHFLQIWIQPHERGLAPSYTEWRPQPGAADAQKILVISPDGRDGSAVIRQDASIYLIRLQPGESAAHALDPGRGFWLHIAQGEAALDGIGLSTGDAASTEQPGAFTLTATAATEALLFDLG